MGVVSEPSLVAVMERLRKKTDALSFGEPVACVYRPLSYAWPVARAYFERYGAGTGKILLLGMNPGPFGMGQTGVPFGEIEAVRGYLGLDGRIRAPEETHPKRPVLGWATTRSEVSGKRLWGAFQKRHPRAEDFFARAFVLNYCPLLFVSESGANVTPDKLRGPERARLESACDEALSDAVRLMAPTHLIGIGQYATKCLARVTGRAVVTIPHPSPASPIANRGWEAAARDALTNAGLVDVL